MNLYCDHYGKDIIHEITKWHTCSIRSMCAGCWYLIDLDEEDINDCDAISSEVFYDYCGPLKIHIECEHLKSHDSCTFSGKCEFKEIRRNKVGKI